MKKLCKSLKEYAIDMTNFNKKKNKVINKRTTEII